MVCRCGYLYTVRVCKGPPLHHAVLVFALLPSLGILPRLESFCEACADGNIYTPLHLHTPYNYTPIHIKVNLYINQNPDLIIGVLDKAFIFTSFILKPSH
jgi:hypothetical protein